MNPFFFAIIGGLAFLLIRQWLHNRRPTLCGNATIVARRTEPGRYMRSRSSSGIPVGTSTINYIVTFRLCDGEEIELLTGEKRILHFAGRSYRPAPLAGQ